MKWGQMRWVMWNTAASCRTRTSSAGRTRWRHLPYTCWFCYPFPPVIFVIAFGELAHSPAAADRVCWCVLITIYTTYFLLYAIFQHSLLWMSSIHKSSLSNNAEMTVFSIENAQSTIAGKVSLSVGGSGLQSWQSSEVTSLPKRTLSV